MEQRGDAERESPTAFAWTGAPMRSADAVAAAPTTASIEKETIAWRCDEVSRKSHTHQGAMYMDMYRLDMYRCSVTTLVAGVSYKV